VMNQGVIDQVGTPSEIYRKPTTAFVADFVGSMTFIDAEVAGPDGVRVGGLSLHCKDAQKFVRGTPVRLGLRPEEVRVRNLDSATQNRLDAQVASLNFLGSFCRARLHPDAAPGITILADFSANLMRDLAVTEGQKLAIALPPESLHLFARG
ncbi:MAG: TOBE domain-containing protein, partial [Pseudorhodoplanes sp.]|nr:TOBE domain-containing protein [Pseudorhodoplanes sp.]